MKSKFFLFIFFVLTHHLTSEEQIKKADVIFFGGDIVTLADYEPNPETLALADGKIIFIGEKKKALFLQTEQTNWVNLQGGALLPGFIASSSNILFHGLTKFTLNLSPSKHKTFSQVISALKEAAKKGPVLAMGYDPCLMTKKGQLNFKTLDAISKTEPIVVINKCGTIAYGNRKSFQLANLSEDSPTPIGGDYQRNKKDLFTGVVYNIPAICSLIKPLQSLLHLDFKAIVEASLKDYAKKGYTTVTDSYLGMDFPSKAEHLLLLQELSTTPSPYIRVQGYGLFSAFDTLVEMKKNNHPYFQILGLSISLDGSLQNYQGALKEKYKNKNSNGNLLFSQNKLNSLIIKARQYDLITNIKASGDLAIAMALKACEKAQEIHFTQNKTFVIEQATLSNPSLLKAMDHFQASPSFCMQDIYLWGDVLKEKILGSKRSNLINLAKSAGNLGIKYSFNEAGALGVIHPLLAIQTSVTRETTQKEVINQGERLSLEEALKTFTLYAAHQTHRNHELGSLEVGKYADFVVLSKSPKKVPATKIATIKVLETWIEGRKYAP